MEKIDKILKKSKKNQKKTKKKPKATVYIKSFFYVNPILLNLKL